MHMELFAFTCNVVMGVNRNERHFHKIFTKPKKTLVNEVINSHLSFMMDTFLPSLFVLHPLGTRKLLLLANNKITIIFITKKR